MNNAGRALAGFVKGFSETGLEGLRARQREEADIRKAKLLEQLRLDTAKELATFELEIDRKKVDKQQTQYDLGAGKKRLYNTEGTMIGEQDLTDYERTRLSMEGEKDALDIQSKRQSMELARRSDARAAAQHSKYMRGLDDTGDGALTDRGREAIGTSILKNLEDLGLDKAELARARQSMINGVQEGWSRDAFRNWESTYLREFSPTLKGRSARERLAQIAAQRKKLESGD